MSSAQGGGGIGDRTSTTEEVLDILRSFRVNLDVALQICDVCISSVAEWGKATIMQVLRVLIGKSLPTIQKLV